MEDSYLPGDEDDETSFPRLSSFNFNFGLYSEDDEMELVVDNTKPPEESKERTI